MVRFGVLGAGSIAHAFCKAVLSTDGILQAIASSSIERANAFVEEYGFINAYDDYEALMKDDQVDCVYIATPHSFHYEQMLECLENNKNVLCEKSFTLNAKQAEVVFALAKEKGLFVMEAMWTRFLPVIKELLEYVKSEDFGEIVKIESGFGFDVSNLARPRLKDLELGGGALLDVGIYPITIANLFLGKPKSIRSKVEFFDTGVDSSEKITYVYENAKCTLLATFEENLGSYTWIYGTKYKALIPFFHGAEEAFIYDETAEMIKTIEYPHEVNGLEYEILEVIYCLENGLLESSIMPPETTVEILRQMDEIRASWNLIYPGESE